MYIRPQRYRILLAFLLGLAISIGLLVAGYFYYQAHRAGQETALRKTISEQLEADFQQKHPLQLTYVFACDKKGGEIISDADLVAAELAPGAIPADAIQGIENAIGKVMRCDITANTVASQSLFFSEEDYPDDLRLMEYTILSLPQKIENGQYLDIRVMFPNGLDYIVLSKKKVIDQIKGEDGQSSILWLHMHEEEILRMASAIVDASLIEGSRLYAVTYVAPDIQKEAVKTYPANSEVLELIKTNPNIVAQAIQTLEQRNREAFEERINQDLEQAGKSKAFGPREYDSKPVNASPQEPVQTEDQAVPTEGQAVPTQEVDPTIGPGLDGRL